MTGKGIGYLYAVEKTAGFCSCKSIRRVLPQLLMFSTAESQSKLVPNGLSSDVEVATNEHNLSRSLADGNTWCSH